MALGWQFIRSEYTEAKPANIYNFIRKMYRPIVTNSSFTSGLQLSIYIASDRYNIYNHIKHKPFH